MSNWQLPTPASQYLDVLAQLKERDVDAATLFVTEPTNPPIGGIKFVRAPTLTLQEWDGVVWQNRILSVASGGTGAASLDDFKASLGLGSMAYQNYNTVNITGGNVMGLTNLEADAMAIDSAVPSLVFVNTSAAVNNKMWQLFADPAGNFTFNIPSDNWSSNLYMMKLTRNLTNPHAIVLNAFTGIKIDPNVNTTALLQVASGFISIVAPDGAISSNLYISDTWRHFQNGVGGMIRFQGQTIDAWVTPAGIAGGAASVAWLYTFGTAGNTINYATSFTSTISVTSAATIGYTLDVGNHTNIAGDLQVSGANARAGASIYLDQSNNIYPGILFRGTGGNWAHLIARTVNDFHITLTSGGDFQFGHLFFQPGGAGAYNIGSPTNYWSNCYALYWQSFTNYGFIFDGTPGRGMVAISGSMEIRHDGGLHLVTGGVAVLSGAVFAPFGVWTVQTTHLMPKGNNTEWLGHDTRKWYGIWLRDGVYHGSDERDKTDIKPEVLGLQFLNLLDPIQYRWRTVPDTARNGTKHGLSAQRLGRVLDALDVDFQGLHVPDSEEGSFGLDYVQLIGPIIKAIQQLDDKVEALAARRR